jgi:hypothetical protein
MTTTRRPPDMYQGPPPQQQSPYRRPTRRPPEPPGVDTMKVAGILFCISAAISSAGAILARETGTAQTSAFGGSFLILVLGLGLFQGVGAVRIFVLASAAIAGVAAIVMVFVLNPVRELQALALATLVAAGGYFALLLRKEASKTRVAVSVGFILAAAAGTVATQHWLEGYGKRAYARELREAASGQREYDNAVAGLSFTVPEGWVILRDDAEIYEEVPSKVALADPDAGAVVFLNYERKGPGLPTLDVYLDAVLEGLKRSGIEATQADRTDVTVGSAPARRMSVTWEEEGLPMEGFITSWLDGERILTLIGISLGGLTSNAQERFAVLEGALRFTAPIETALSDAAARLTAECSIFTPTSVRTIARRISPDSPTEAYFKVGWSWAQRGQGLLDGASQGELGEIMTDVFAQMSPADRTRFGNYSAKLMAGQRTGRSEDGAAMRILGGAVARLSPASLSRLQTLVDAALTGGGLT